MVYIKKLVANGFKSFGKKTEVVFDRGINVIVGPNGSGKSNISDALCFALGRLSAKSMRASKSTNMIFMGSKYVKPAGEASVEIVFDNGDKSFSIEKEEISLKRIVRRNGQGIYKINDETKTRGEVIDLLLQAGIDPYGHNMILQGQIQSLVRMHPEERRKIIEEVAGISIYELRKEKSLKELDKTDEKLKEINAVLRERTAYLKNLERERAQALKYKDLEGNLKRVKASILGKRLEEKNRELDSILKSIDEKNKHKDKMRANSLKLQEEIDSLSGNIEKINKHIKEASGLEQETLHNTIANLRAELEGLKVRKENYDNRKAETEKRISELVKNIPDLEGEIQELKKKSPMMAKKAEELKKKKLELEQLEEEKKVISASRSELSSLRDRIKDKNNYLSRIVGESDSLLAQLEEFSKDLIYNTEEECHKALESFDKTIKKTRGEIERITSEELESEKKISVLESEIEKAEKVKKDVSEIDTCPLCQSNITQNHKEHVHREADGRMMDSLEKIENIKDKLSNLKKEKANFSREIENAENKLTHARTELMKHKTIRDRKQSIKRIVEQEKSLKEELNALEERKKALEGKSENLSELEGKYHAKMLEIEEISSRTTENIDQTILYKQRDIEGYENAIKRGKKDIEELEITLNELGEGIERKSESLEKKEEQERELNERFQKMFEERDNLQTGLQSKNLSLTEVQGEIRSFDDQTNYLRIGQAKIDAEREALQVDLSGFSGVELIKVSMQILEERLEKTQQAIREIGSINMRALEVYESIKKEYDEVQDKANILLKEKEDIMKIVEEIDRKKTKTFMKTFNAINGLFTSNFAKLYTKGVAHLEIENKEELFNGGIDIVIKLAKGKYFDVTSLSGGEQTLVALALLFAIQEHKPYHFYIFDEIDAALDKRNSERLAGLLNQYMKAGQYIVITHNDAIIMDSDVLYGVSMHDGITKILSLNLNEEGNIKQYTQPQVQAQPEANAQQEQALAPQIPNPVESKPSEFEQALDDLGDPIGEIKRE